MNKPALAKHHVRKVLFLRLLCPFERKQIEAKAVKSALWDGSLAFGATALWPHELPLQEKVHALLMLPITV